MLSTEDYRIIVVREALIVGNTEEGARAMVNIPALEEKTIDLEALGALAVVERGNMKKRSPAMIHKAVVHWPYELVPDITTREQEITILQSFANLHVYERNWSDSNEVMLHGRSIMYAWAIGLSGTRYRCQSEDWALWHCRGGNYEALGTVVVVGPHGKLTQECVETLVQHLDWLTARSDINIHKSQVWGHGECGLEYGGGPLWRNDTTCPGPELLELVRKYRNSVPPLSQAVRANSHDNLFFSETMHSLSGAFLDYWRSNNGADTLGIALTEELSGDDYPFSTVPLLAGRKVQLFERGVLYIEGDSVKSAPAGVEGIVLPNGVVNSVGKVVQ